MIGPRYWSTGITVTYRHHVGTTNGVSRSGWGASLKFYDNGFCNDEPDLGQVSTEGTLSTRYYVSDGQDIHGNRVDGLTIAIDTLIADATRLGIEFGGPAGQPWIYVPGDGRDPGQEYHPAWRQIVADQAARLGWASAYQHDETNL